MKNENKTIWIGAIIGGTIGFAWGLFSFVLGIFALRQHPTPITIFSYLPVYMAFTILQGEYVRLLGTIFIGIFIGLTIGLLISLAIIYTSEMRSKTKNEKRKKRN